MNLKSVAKTIGVAAIAVGGSLLLYVAHEEIELEKRKESYREKARSASYLAKKFGKVTQKELNKIIEETPRALKAVIEGDTLNYIFKSASGKTKHTAFIKLDEQGNIKEFISPYIDANSPKFFVEKLNKLIKLKSDDSESLA